MKPKPILLVVGIALISLLAIGTLYFVSGEKANYRYAGFERNFVSNLLTVDDTLQMNYYGYYFAGHTNHTIYLGNRRDPTHLVSVNKWFTDTVHHRLWINGDSLQYRYIHVTVDSPEIYMADGTRPFIYKGSVAELETNEWITDPHFTKAIPFSRTSIAMISIQNLENTVIKKVKGKRPEMRRDILQEQGDGIFSTDGMFLFDKKSMRFVYIYFYRNEYITMDTTFDSVMSGNTIDTITVAKIKTGKINSQNSFTMTAPALRVNNQSTILGDILFVQSNLLAKNEDENAFENGSVIDAYDVQNRIYQLSFYIPTYNGQKVEEFLFMDSITLIALYEPYLVRFKLKNIIAQ